MLANPHIKLYVTLAHIFMWIRKRRFKNASWPKLLKFSLYIPNIHVAQNCEIVILAKSDPSKVTPLFGSYLTSNCWTDFHVVLDLARWNKLWVTIRTRVEWSAQVGNYPPLWGLFPSHSHVKLLPPPCLNPQYKWRRIPTTGGDPPKQVGIVPHICGENHKRRELFPTYVGKTHHRG